MDAWGGGSWRGVVGVEIGRIEGADCKAVS